MAWVTNMTHDPMQMFIKVLVNNLKRTDTVGGKEAPLPWKPYYQAFRTLLEDYEVWSPPEPQELPIVCSNLH